MQASKGQKLSHEMLMKRCQQLIYSEKSVLMFDLMIYAFNMFMLEA